jgi:hypothetical protein
MRLPFQEKCYTLMSLISNVGKWLQGVAWYLDGLVGASQKMVKMMNISCFAK